MMKLELFSRLEKLLSTPDHMMTLRRNHITQLGDPMRRSTVGLPLLIRWYQHRHLMVDGEPITKRGV